uniref:Uncharacterized protein n=1 Tax=Anaerolinea thermolimosa TaxID=229919 RepID=A0A7C4PGT3_9CHLR
MDDDAAYVIRKTAPSQPASLAGVQWGPGDIALGGVFALVLFFLMRLGWVEPLGLLVGLSVVMLSILAWGVGQARKLSKEAV